MRRLVGLIAWTAALLTVSAEAADVSFQNLRSQLDQQNPSLKQAALPKEIAGLGGKAARLQFAPELSFRSSKNWLRDSSGDGWPPNRASNIFELSWTVFDGLTRFKDVTIADLTEEQAQQQELSDRANVFSTLAGSYLDWQTAVARIDILQELVRLRKENVEKVRRRVGTGELGRTESLLFENQLLEAEDRLLQAISQRDAAVTAIAGLLPGSPLDPASQAPKKEPLFQEDYCGLDTAEIEKHPTLQGLRRAISIATAQQERTQSTFYPTAELGAEQHMNAWGDPSAGPNETYLTATLTWRLSDALVSQYDRQIAAIQRHDAQLALDAGLVLLRNSRDDNCRRLAHLKGRLKNSVGLIDNTEKLYNQGERKFARAGLSSLDLIRLQSDLLTARLQAVQLQRDQQQLRLQQTLIFAPVTFPTAY